MDEKALLDSLSGDDLTEQIRAIQRACRDRRDDLIPALVALLASEEVGHFAEECLPQFGEKVHRRLGALLADQDAPPLARSRAAGIVALFGDRAALPLLLDAVGDPALNQAYLQRLAALDPEALTRRIVQVLWERKDEILTTQEPRHASYFAALLHTIGDLGAQRQALDALVRFEHESQDWRIQQAASEALRAS